MSPSTRSGPPRRRYRRIPGLPRDPVKARLLRLYAALARRFGPQRWWPGRTAFEVAAGAILTQHTAWTNVERALRVLARHGLLEPGRLDAVPGARLAELIRPAGTFRVKARRLRAFARFLLARFGGRMARLRSEPLPPLRAELLRVPGLGPETADAILLYAAGRPVFVVDAYARRVFARHRLIPPDTRYETVRAFAERHLPSDPRLFNEYHALLVAVGKRYCRTVPRCAECPLRPDLHGRPPRAI
jgi:endonuclease-3 related protein